MFDDMTVNIIEEQTEEQKEKARELSKTSLSNIKKKNEQMNAVEELREKADAKEEMDAAYQARKEANDEAELAKDEEEAIARALKKKYEEEQRRREAFFAKQEEEQKKAEWEEAQKKKEKKNGLSLGTLLSNAFPKSSGEVTDKEVRKTQAENEKLRKAAYEDKLVGLYNRNKYEEDIQIIPVKNLIVASVDANNLKYINDNMGHEAGDMLLKAIAEDLKACLKTEYIYRTGGDEFVCFFLQTSLDEVGDCLQAFEERLTKRNEEKKKKEDEVKPIYSVAYGFSGWIKGDSFEDILKRADEKMYDMKRAYKEAHPELDMRRRAVTTKKAEAVPTTESKPEVKPKESKKEAKSKVSAIPKKPAKKGKATTAPAKNAKPLPAYTPIANPDAAAVKLADFMPTKGGNHVPVTGVQKEYVTMRDRLRQIQTETRQEEVVDMIDNINAMKKDVVMICIVTQSLDTLFLLRKVEDFFSVCEKLDDEISVSYVYVLYRTLGMKYYMKKPQEELIQQILSDIADLFKKNSVVTDRMLAKVNNIGFFKKIFVQ